MYLEALCKLLGLVQKEGTMVITVAPKDGNQGAAVFQNSPELSFKPWKLEVAAISWSQDSLGLHGPCGRD